MSDEEKWVKAYEKLKKEGMLAPAVDYEELFAKSEFQGKKLFLFSMGTVTFPTGKIIVCDPLVYLDKNTVPYREKVPVGTFMLETLAAEMEEGNFRYIATRIRFAEEEAAYYELALTGTEDLSDWKNFDYIGFAVDAGLATVADVKVRDAYCKFESDWYEKNPEGNIYDDFFADIFAESYEAAPRFQREGGRLDQFHDTGNFIPASHDTERIRRWLLSRVLRLRQGGKSLPDGHGVYLL